MSMAETWANLQKHDASIFPRARDLFEDRGTFFSSRAENATAEKHRLAAKQEGESRQKSWSISTCRSYIESTRAPGPTFAPRPLNSLTALALSRANCVNPRQLASPCAEKKVAKFSSEGSWVTTEQRRLHATTATNIWRLLPRGSCVCTFPFS